MAVMREAWTDERLDDLSRGMDKGFDRVDRDLRDLRTEMDTRFARLETRFDSMQRMTLAAYVTAILGLIATQL